MKNVIRKGGWLFVLLCVALIMNNRFGYITIIGLFLILAGSGIFFRKTTLDKTGLAIAIYCVIYIIFSTFNGFDYSLSTLILYLVAPPIFYYYGTRISDFCDTERDLSWVWFIILLCYAIDVIITGVSNIAETGELIATSRSLSFYEGQEVSATNVGLPLNIGVVGVSMAIFCSERKLKVSYFLLAFFSTLIVVHLLNRTGLVVLISCLIGLVGVRSLKSGKFLVMTVLLVLLVSFILGTTEIMKSEVVSLYAERNKVEGIEGRSDRWVDHFGNLLIKPFGWAEDGEIYYIHNMWLDIARVSGLVPFSILLVLSVSFFWKSIKNALKYNYESSYLILGLNICFFASCFVEPIYGGTHFMLYCMLWGCQFAWQKKYR